MPSFRPFSPPLLLATAFAVTCPAELIDDDAYRLDPLVVSAGFDDKTAFDLAQGASILAGTALRRSTQATLGDTLDGIIGVNSTFHGPGASRPIIRGVGGDRIRVLQGGIGSLDASSISPDHNTALEPLFASRIEVLRGPAALLYGSSALGGAVNVVDNRIPEQPLERPLTGALELRGFGAADEMTSLASLGAGGPGHALRLNALRQHTGDVRIPGRARIDADAPADQPSDVLPNSDTEKTSASLGGSVFGSTGWLGLALSTYESDYGVPVDEPISISLRQRRLDLEGELTRPFGIFDGARLRAGVSDYQHREIADHETVNTTFRNDAAEARLELPHAFSPAVSGTAGVQATRSDFSAVGEEVVTPPSLTQNLAAFALEEWKVGRWSFQVGGRIEAQSVRLGDVPEGLPRIPGYAAASGQRERQTGASASAGVVLYPAKDWSIGMALAYTERLPTAQELFSNGPHGGTGAWEIGRAGLDNERSLGVDLSVRRRAGFVSGAVSVFANRFDGYIFEERLPDAALPPEVNEEGLTPYQFTAKDAEFYGGEAELIVHLVDRRDYLVHLQLTSDYVHAQQTTDDEPLPRIPPHRVGAALRLDTARWQAGVAVRRASAQRRIGALETPTPAYTLVNADVTYTIRRSTATYELFARGTNLANETARLHTSFLKEFAPLPGRSVVIGARVLF